MSDKKPLTGVSLFLLTLALGLGTFIQVLDTSIANVSIPSIAGDLGATPDQGTWVITSFAVSNAIVLPLTGWLAMRFGEVRIFAFSTTLFSILSWLCGLAWTLPVLIFLRVLQGAAAGSLIPLSQSLLLQNYPVEKKGMALGLWSMVVIAAPLLGPILGGWITDEFGWPWIFYINVPLGLISALLTWRLLAARDNVPKKIPIDVIGFALLILGVGSLQVFLDKGNELDWFESNQISILALIAAIGLLFFSCWNAYSRHPVVDFTFFKDRNFTVATLLSGVGFLLFFGSIIIQPLWLQVRENYTPVWAGVTVAPFGIFTIILSPIIGRNIHRLDARALASFSFIILAMSYFWTSHFNADVSLGHIIMPRILQGLGLAFFFIPLITIALSEIPNDRLSSASGVFNFVRLISGGGIGTALFVNFWTRWETFYHARLGESVTIYSNNSIEALQNFQQMGIETPEAYELLNKAVIQQASVLSINDLFWLSAWTVVFLIPIPWLCRRVKGSGPMAVAVE